MPLLARVGQVGAGQFFGGMSLLTGAPRSATLSVAVETLAYEITKDDLDALISLRPEIAHDIADVVAQREARNRVELERADTDAREAEVRSLAEQLYKKMSDLFGALRGLRN